MPPTLLATSQAHSNSRGFVTSRSFLGGGKIVGGSIMVSFSWVGTTEGIVETKGTDMV